MNQPGTICEHLTPGGWPFSTELVIDEQLGMTDGIVRCLRCGTHYLLEMLDWHGNERLFRVSVVAADDAVRLLHDLTRGSCDLTRAGAEVRSLQTQTSFSPWLLRVDTRGPRIGALLPAPADRRMPGASWRDLPCDGSWLGYADAAGSRSSTEIRNG
ncbi:MAG: hypothetical protein R3E86_16205 [Pseudomonadales bacterium]